MKLYTLGTSHGRAETGRSCSVNVLETNGKYYIFDCGGNVEGKMTDLGLEFENIKAVFISHMHSDHVGNLHAIANRFVNYNKTDDKVKIHLPEHSAIGVFKQWILAMGIDVSSDRIIYSDFCEGKVYSDENLEVYAISTKHLESQNRPSYAFYVKTEDEKFIYTGDLWHTFEDYPEVIFKEDFDAVLCELVHFNPETNLEKIIKSRTKKLIFTHLAPRNIPKIEAVKNKFPFDVFIANDGDCYEI